MPFDGAGFQRRPAPRRRATRDDNIVSVAIIGIALALLVTPISLAALVDLVRFIRH